DLVLISLGKLLALSLKLLTEQSNVSSPSLLETTHQHASRLIECGVSLVDFLLSSLFRLIPQCGDLLANLHELLLGLGNRRRVLVRVLIGADHGDNVIECLDE